MKQKLTKPQVSKSNCALLTRNTVSKESRSNLSNTLNKADFKRARSSPENHWTPGFADAQVLPINGAILAYNIHTLSIWNNLYAQHYVDSSQEVTQGIMVRKRFAAAQYGLNFHPKHLWSMTGWICDRPNAYNDSVFWADRPHVEWSTLQ